MRSNLDGTNLTTLISANMYEPSAITVDHSTSRLYWLDDEEGIHYKLEQANLDGTNRSMLIHGQHQQPVHLAVDTSGVFWTDFVYGAVWTVSKDTRAGDEPVSFKSYYDSNRQVDPMSILARDNIGKEINCKAMRADAVKRAADAATTTTLKMPQPTPQSFNNFSASSEDQDVCYNGGLFVNGACSCKAG